jgi:arylsulfatase A-like enzyme
VDKLGLREKTVIIFSADNGTARASRTLKGRALSGHKGSMLDCGAHVPFIASWKGTAPQGKVLQDLVDFSDLFPTFAELAGSKMPSGFTFDGRSLAPQLRGQPGNPREWIFVQLGANWYARELKWKLNNQGELFDMTDAPFVEKLIAADARDAQAVAARKHLQTVLDQLNPAGGKTVPPDAAGKKAKKRKKNR